MADRRSRRGGLGWSILGRSWIERGEDTISAIDDETKYEYLDDDIDDDDTESEGQERWIWTRTKENCNFKTENIDLCELSRSFLIFQPKIRQRDTYMEIFTLRLCRVEKESQAVSSRPRGSLQHP